jgi:hypothetical protein
MRAVQWASSHPLPDMRPRRAQISPRRRAYVTALAIDVIAPTIDAISLSKSLISSHLLSELGICVQHDKQLPVRSSKITGR